MEKTHICVPCKRNLCLECYIDSHSGHEKVLLKDKFDEVLSSIETEKKKQIEIAKKRKNKLQEKQLEEKANLEKAEEEHWCDKSEGHEFWRRLE